MNTMKPLAVTPDTIWSDITAIREQRPLVHNITNYVVMEFSANALLALGASPVMAHAREEAADMASIASALVLNIGTLSPAWIEAMHLAQQAAATSNTPIILDPVGCGATAYRTDTARRLMQESKPAVIRGNASEIAALYGTSKGATRGVDSTLGVSAAEQSAQALANKTSGTVVISGPVDVVATASTFLRIRNGHAMMANVTGMGCSASALIGAFCAVNTNRQQAATHAMATMGICGELAAGKSEGPGSFKTAFLDALHNLKLEALTTRLKVSDA
jgi:hydroxyethylthiazole kinase